MKVMHYYTYPDISGGPLSYIKNIVNSSYLTDVTFAECYQMKPFLALRRRDFKRIVEEIKAFSPDILHIHGLQAEGFVGVLAGKKAGVKTLMTVHGMQPDAQDIGPFKKFLFGRLIEPYTLRKSDAVFCVCKAMERRKPIQKHATRLLPTLYNFIPDTFLAEEETALTLPEHAGKTVVTYVGRITEEKGMKELEYCVLNDGSDQTQYWVVGDGLYKATMEQHLAKQIQEGKVFFFGQQSEVKPFLKESDIFLFPTYHENLSIALLEAASQGCCCVVSDVGGNPEVVEDSVSGITFPAQNPDAALSALTLALDSPARRKEMAEALYERLQSVFSEKAFSEKLLQIYQNVL